MNGFDKLTDRHMAIVRRIAQGKTNKEIGYDLLITDQTVKNHITVILRTLGAPDRARVAYLFAKTEDGVNVTP